MVGFVGSSFPSAANDTPSSIYTKSYPMAWGGGGPLGSHPGDIFLELLFRDFFVVVMEVVEEFEAGDVTNTCDRFFLGNDDDAGTDVISRLWSTASTFCQSPNLRRSAFCFRF
jgi:hypothetical protein